MKNGELFRVGGAAEGEDEDADEHQESGNQENEDAMIEGLDGQLAGLRGGAIAHGTALGGGGRSGAGPCK
jgi:hypothetical protein